MIDENGEIMRNCETNMMVEYQEEVFKYTYLIYFDESYDFVIGNQQEI